MPANVVAAVLELARSFMNSVSKAPVEKPHTDDIRWNMQVRVFLVLVTLDKDAVVCQSSGDREEASGKVGGKVLVK